jgi:hypothetical protein
MENVCGVITCDQMKGWMDEVQLIVKVTLVFVRLTSQDLLYGHEMEELGEVGLTDHMRALME